MIKHEAKRIKMKALAISRFIVEQNMNLRGGVAYWQSPNGAEPINQAHAICSLREILELRQEVERVRGLFGNFENDTIIK